MNMVILTGNLGQDPEVTYTQSGTALAKFSLATSEKWTDKGTGQKQERTEWHRIVAWGRLAEVCGEYLSKGRKIAMVGKIQYRSWDKDDGTKGYATDIVMQQMEMMPAAGGNQGTRSGSGGYSQPPSGRAPGGQAPGMNYPGGPGPKDDDIPF